jgi:hypothetical protein
MKPVIIAIFLGLVAGFVASMFFLYSLWLPLTAIFLVICGVIGSNWKISMKPSFVAATLAILIYLGWFWLPPELASLRASTADQHAVAARLMGGRAQLFGDDVRAFEHLEKAAEMDHLPSLLAVGNAYLYGHYHVRRDPERARNWLERAKKLGSEEASDSLSSDYHYPPKS